MKRLPASVPTIALAALAALAAGVLLGSRIFPDDAAPGAKMGAPALIPLASNVPAPSAALESGLPEEVSMPAPRPTEARPAAVPSRPRRPASKERIRPLPRPEQVQAARPPAVEPPHARSSAGQGGSAAAPAAGGGEPSSGMISTGATPMPSLGTSPQGTDAAAPPAAAPAPASAQPQGASSGPVPPPVTAPTITPPVPVTLRPPQHPDAWRVVVETPGLAAEARAEQLAARVRLRLLVREDGAVGRVEVVVPSGRPGLDSAAAEAAAGWRFLPARRDGVPIASIVLIWVSFVVVP